MDKIVLDEKYSIEWDAYNWILKYKSYGNVSKKTGKRSVNRRESYYPNIKMLLKHYLDASLKGSKSIDEVLSRISEVEQIINKIFLQNPGELTRFASRSLEGKTDDTWL